ncbi:hypothetical protein JOD54_004888 [Actinokineospora baliensis]|uniref:hypothetical protein n=1 Tax=Actinokineospora baliensis TaxID=547056 RepID=UPI00195AE6FA|nr:hypothetical protein [Actinokineospora baliensis]MBM7774684.1 hypothetical protein [Actinokineospora baliensis]
MVKKAMAGLILAAAAMGVAGTASATTTTGSDVFVVQGSCGDKPKNPVTTGGEAAWTITCGGGKIRVQGWVKDTKADGKAAEVYGSWGDGANFGTVHAAPAGTRVDFNKQHAGTSVYLYLRVV